MPPISSEVHLYHLFDHALWPHCPLLAGQPRPLALSSFTAHQCLGGEKSNYSLQDPVPSRIAARGATRCFTTLPAHLARNPDSGRTRPPSHSLTGTSHPINHTPSSRVFIGRKSLEGKWVLEVLSNGQGSAAYRVSANTTPRLLVASSSGTLFFLQPRQRRNSFVERRNAAMR